MHQTNDFYAASSSAKPADQRLPIEISGYKLLRSLGSGGMGQVFAAEDAGGNEVAFKLLHPWVAADPRARARLEREVKMLLRVRSKHVASLLDVEIDDKDMFMVTELVQGNTLDEDVKTHGAYSITELLVLAETVAQALEDVHQAGVVHRDLKPSNVMVCERGPILIDFGIAQVLNDERLTRTGLVTGTPGFLDPDVMAGSAPGELGDWWSWAAIVLFAATGRPPFGAGGANTIFARVEAGRPDISGIPWALGRILQIALHPKPTVRASSSEVINVLRALAKQDEQQASAIADMASTVAMPVGGLETAGADLLEVAEVLGVDSTRPMEHIHTPDAITEYNDNLYADTQEDEYGIYDEYGEYTREYYEPSVQREDHTYLTDEYDLYENGQLEYQHDDYRAGYYATTEQTEYLASGNFYASDSSYAGQEHEDYYNTLPIYDDSSKHGRESFYTDVQDTREINYPAISAVAPDNYELNIQSTENASATPVITKADLPPGAGGLAVGCLIFVAILAGFWPRETFVVSLGLMLVLAALGSTSLFKRRLLKRGRTVGAANALATTTFVGHLLTAAIKILPGLGGGLFAGGAVVAILRHQNYLSFSHALSVGVGFFIFIVWIMPGAYNLRIGFRVCTTAILPSHAYRALVALLLISLAVLLFVGGYTGLLFIKPSLWPLPLPLWVTG